MRVRRQYIAICSDLEGADCELTPIARHTERTSTLMPHASCLMSPALIVRPMPPSYSSAFDG